MNVSRPLKSRTQTPRSEWRPDSFLSVGRRGRGAHSERLEGVLGDADDIAVRIVKRLLEGRQGRAGVQVEAIEGVDRHESDPLVGVLHGRDEDWQGLLRLPQAAER